MTRDEIIEGFEKEIRRIHREPKEKMLGICVTVDEAEKIVALLKEQEAKKGTWQWKIHGKAESGGTLGEAICDQCGKSTYATAVKGDLHYCPNCGAKMEGVKPGRSRK